MPRGSKVRAIGLHSAGSCCSVPLKSVGYQQKKLLTIKTRSIGKPIKRTKASQEGCLIPYKTSQECCLHHLLPRRAALQRFKHFPGGSCEAWTSPAKDLSETTSLGLTSTRGRSVPVSNVFTILTTQDGSTADCRGDLCQGIREGRASSHQGRLQE